MALRTPALWMGNPTVQHPAQNDRLLLSSLLDPESASTAASRPLTAVSGALIGPAGTMGEVTVLSNTQFTVNPGRWYVGATASALGGSYQVTNDALATLAITAQDASQFRRSYWGVWVIDSFVAGSGDDLPHWGLVDGPLAASSPQLPAAGVLPANFLALGEFLIPPTGQTVTYTPYSPRVSLRGSVTPVLNDTSTLPGHGGAPGSYLGDYRDHPVWGLQRWNGTRWVSVTMTPAYFTDMGPSATPNGASPVTTIGPRTIDPAALFGVGMGCLVEMDCRCLIDRGSGDAYWYLGATVNGTSGAFAGGLVNAATTRQILGVTHKFTIPAGSTAQVSQRIDTAGASVTGNVYADGSNHRMQTTVWPLYA